MSFMSRNTTTSQLGIEAKICNPIEVKQKGKTALGKVLQKYKNLLKIIGNHNDSSNINKKCVLWQEIEHIANGKKTQLNQNRRNNILDAIAKQNKLPTTINDNGNNSNYNQKYLLLDRKKCAE